ncbi:MAG: hypothetical protein JNL11_11585 [Bdellovibrionaceae bacterium]|nr:hypothetical protein [Pseudobdellovibrionaceae bacterium]
MGTIIIGNPRQQRQANTGASWALGIVFATLIILAFIGWNLYQASP